jgi:hypothetical protein
MKWRSGVPLSLDDFRFQEFDHDRLFNPLNVPDHAGPFAVAIEGILRRIPDGWGDANSDRRRLGGFPEDPARPTGSRASSWRGRAG